MSDPDSPTDEPRTLPAGLRLGPVQLTVADLERSIAFYGEALGLRTLRREATDAALGSAEEPLVVLEEEPGVRPAGRHAGLFHVALLHPSRRALAHALGRLVSTRTAIDGASDHGVSEALYLRDPDGHGIELYADRPPAAWPAPAPGERVGIFTAPLDVGALLGLVEGEEPEPHADAGLRVGHVHLHVGDLERAEAFYRAAVGLELMARYPGAAFLAAGGYHHHLGVNVWNGRGVGPPPEGRARLRTWTLALGDGAAVEALGERVRAAGVEVRPDADGLRLADPWETGLRVVA